MSDTPKLPKREAEIAALNNFGAALQRVIVPDEIDGYRDDGGSWTVENDGTISVRVIETSRDDTLRRNDEFIDPYWNVEIVTDPDGLLAELHSYSLWVYGPSIEIVEADRATGL